MIRRAVLAAAAAVAFILAPAAGMAYASAGFSLPAADPTPGAGVPFNVLASGAKAHEVVTLTITRKPAPAGTHPRWVTKTANAAGVAEFAVVLTEDGTYAIVSTSASGVVLSRQSVTVVDHGSVIVAGEGAAASAGAGSSSAGAGSSSAGAGSSSAGAAAGSAGGAPAVAGGRLATTGFRGAGLAVGGGVLVLAGAGLVLVARPRSRAQVPARNLLA